MANLVVPSVGGWYRHTDGRVFEVVAFDEPTSTIETQHFDGTVEEIDVDVWDDQEPTEIEPPEDYTGSMDLQKEDYGVEYDDCPHAVWFDPLDFFDAGDR
ncbi:MAG: DUF6763 family protein [Pseudomonadota bacterium]